MVNLFVKDQGLNLVLDFIQQLKAVTGENLNPIILERIMGSRDHDASIGTQAPSQERDPGGGNWTDE